MATQLTSPGFWSKILLKDPWINFTVPLSDVTRPHIFVVWLLVADMLEFLQLYTFRKFFADIILPTFDTCKICSQLLQEHFYTNIIIYNFFIFIFFTTVPSMDEMQSNHKSARCVLQANTQIWSRCCMHVFYNIKGAVPTRLQRPLQDNSMVNQNKVIKIKSCFLSVVCSAKPIVPHRTFF